MASFFIVDAEGRRWIHSLLWMLGEEMASFFIVDAGGGDGFIVYCG